MSVLALTVPAPAELARETIAAHSKSFALASRLLGQRTRDHTAIVSTYCRRADDAIDDVVPSAQPAALAACATSSTTSPACLSTACSRRSRRSAPRWDPRAYPEALLAGMEMDVSGMRYTTAAELHLYCYRVAGVVGLVMSHVFGVRDDAALVPAARLGIAMQLTNICRDVAEDWERGRLYIPDELCAAHGAPGLAGDLGRPLPASAIAPLASCVRDLLAAADLHYRAADRGVPALPFRAGLAVRAARNVYSAIGSRIRATGCDVTAGRAVVPRGAKIALVGGAAVRSLAGLPQFRRVRLPVRILEVADVPLA
ncbi:MAG: phytoene/squalene synthase family protein [Kofleriaceae bacterium]